MITQNSKILHHLQEGRSISPLKALGLYGCFRLAARIGELRAAGHHIETMIKADGTGRNYATYDLVV
jgi:hypothetical protein|tara:strand:- start:3940 stop:4140 length:201 start_codon:yes stop_codon:yes gene_type:complete